MRISAVLLQTKKVTEKLQSGTPFKYLLVTYNIQWKLSKNY